MEKQKVRDAQIEQLFRYIDNDDNGAIDLDELKGPMLTIGLANSSNAVQKMIRNVSDNDEVTLDQFKQLLDKNSHHQSGALRDPPSSYRSRGERSHCSEATRYSKHSRNMLDELCSVGRGGVEGQLDFASLLLAKRRATLITAILGDQQTPGFHAAQAILRAILGDLKAQRERKSH